MNTLKILAVVSTAFVALAAAPYAKAADQAMTDHAAMAKDYQAKAAAANEKVATHEAMAKMGSPKGNPQAMATHCEGMIADAKAEAADYSAKAAEEQKLADAQSATMTPEQHLAAARDLEAKAAAANAKAAEHEKMARLAGSAKDDGQAMDNHCGHLVDQYRAQADALTAQAAEHRRLAAK